MPQPPPHPLRSIAEAAEIDPVKNQSLLMQHPLRAHHLFDEMPTLFLRLISALLRLLRGISYFLLPKNLRRPIIPQKPPPTPLPPPATAAADDEPELRRAFGAFDRDGDGRITKEEMRDSLENLGIFISDGDLSAAIGRVDADGDGCVDMGEFRELYRSVVVAGAEEEDLREAFEVFDADGDGYISAEELGAVLSTLGIGGGGVGAGEECRRMIGAVDEDGDGRVSFEEFRRMMHQPR